MKITTILEKRKGAGFLPRPVGANYLRSLLGSVDALEHLAADRAADEVFGIELVEHGDGIGPKTFPLAAVGDCHEVLHWQFTKPDRAAVHGENHVHPTLQVAAEGLVGEDQLELVAGLCQPDDLHHLTDGLLGIALRLGAPMILLEAPWRGLRPLVAGLALEDDDVALLRFLVQLATAESRLVAACFDVLTVVEVEEDFPTTINVDETEALVVPTVEELYGTDFHLTTSFTHSWLQSGTSFELRFSRSTDCSQGSPATTNYCFIAICSSRRTEMEISIYCLKYSIFYSIRQAQTKTSISAVLWPKSYGFYD